MLTLLGMLTLLSWLLFGLLLAAAALRWMPGPQALGLRATAGLGVLGSLGGAMVANLVTHRPVLELHGIGFIGSVIGFLALMSLFPARSEARA